jgi:hypothetical protein
MHDNSHEETEVYRTPKGFRFVDFIFGTVETVHRCVFVRLPDMDLNELPRPSAVDLDSPDGLALIGCSSGDKVPGDILWDSEQD